MKQRRSGYNEKTTPLREQRMGNSARRSRFPFKVCRMRTSGDAGTHDCGKKYKATFKKSLILCKKYDILVNCDIPISLLLTR